MCIRDRAYVFALWLFRRSGQQAWANPVLIAIFVIILFLWASDIPYARYFEGAHFIHFLLGPATVALAVPLFAHWKRLKRMAFPLIVALIAGSATAAFSAMASAASCALAASGKVSGASDITEEIGCSRERPGRTIRLRMLSLIHISSVIAT